ncbi:alpha/beta fold hydrolase [Enterobacter hormaechei]
MEYPLLDNTDLPLVLLGGTLCNARLWQPVIERLNVSAVLCITLTGAESAPQASRRLLKVLPPRFLLAGFSLGAIVALQMAADAPERVNGLTLISVNPLPVAPDTLASRREAVHTAQARAWPTGWSPRCGRAMSPRHVCPIVSCKRLFAEWRKSAALRPLRSKRKWPFTGRTTGLRLTPSPAPHYF